MGNRIKLRRKELHIKQSELAERLDISNNHISSIENGREKPSLDMFLKICEELKVTPDYLLLGNVHANNILCAWFQSFIYNRYKKGDVKKLNRVFHIPYSSL